MKFRIVALVLGAAGLLLASAAQADPTLSIVWQSSMTATTSATATNQIVGDVVVTGDSLSVHSVFITIGFDNTELFALGSIEYGNVPLPGMGNFLSPLNQGTMVNNGLGVVTNFESGAPPGQPGLLGVDGPRSIGSVVFHVISPSGAPGEEDVLVEISNPGVDTVLDEIGNERCTVQSGGAPCIFVGADVVPEPGTAVLAAVSLVTLLGLKRRRA